MFEDLPDEVNSESYKALRYRAREVLIAKANIFARDLELDGATAQAIELREAVITLCAIESHERGRVLRAELRERARKKARNERDARRRSAVAKTKLDDLQRGVAAPG